MDLVDRLPRGLCARLFAIPVRLDAITGTVDVAVADPADPHPLNEIAFHLGTPVRAVRASLGSIEEALRRLRMQMSLPPPEPALARSLPQQPPPEPWHPGAPPAVGPPPAAPKRRGLVIEEDSAPPPAPPPPPPTPRTRLRTPPWGTPLHLIAERVEAAPQAAEVLLPPPRRPTEQPPSGYGSEIPIPLTRKTNAPPPLAQVAMLRRATQKPPPGGLGEGYPIESPAFHDVIERRAEPQGSFIPGPPPVPEWSVPNRPSYAAYAPQLPFAEMSGMMAALRNAGSRDEVLELVLSAARMVALKVGLFVVKKGGYLGWIATPEFADRGQIQSVLIPLESNSVFDRAVREDLYLGPIRRDDTHVPLLRVLKNPSRDVAVVPIRVSGKTAVIIVADELGDTMIGTRRLEELARAAGDAFGRIVRTRR
jgi:hypothetical protein